LGATPCRFESGRPHHDNDLTGSNVAQCSRSCVAACGPHLWFMQRFTASDLKFDTTRPLSREDRIARLDALATLFDTAFVIPGTGIRFGLDALIGLVPGIGDAITTLMSLYIVNEARALGAPRLLVGRMVANVALDGVVGAVPLVGDVFDVAWRANRRNMALLRDHLDKTEGPRAPYYAGGRG
jgi:hypothetical protein